MSTLLTTNMLDQSLKSVIDGKAPLNLANSSNAGLMSYADKAKLDKISLDYVFPDEFDSLAGSGSSHDDFPAFQAMLAASLSTGRIPAGRPNTRYYLSNVLNFDPSRQGFEGNGCTLDFRLKTFTDPTVSVEKLSDPSFDTGTPWVISPANTLAPTFNGDLNFVFADGAYNYLEVGQQVSCSAGDTLQITLVVNEITTRTVGVNTFRSILLSLRTPIAGNPASSVSSGALAGTIGQVTNVDTGYTGAGSTFTFLATSGVANPYLRIQSNAQVRIASVSVKVLPRNNCILMRTPSDGQQRGHNWHNFSNFRVSGRSDQASWVDGILFDTQVSGFSSRANFYNVDISDSIGRGLVFANRAYLMNFYSCRIVASEACVDTLPNSSDAGENIAFFGGNLGGGKIGIRNTAGFAIRLFGTSIDFSRQWIVGGQVHMFGGWLETNPATLGYPLIDVQNGEVVLRQTKVQVDGSTTAVLDYPFSVAKGCLLDIEADGPYNLHGTQGALCTGEGRFRFVGVGGSSKEIDTITKRDVAHNLMGSGGSFEDSTIPPLMWTTSTSAQVQIDRYSVGWSSSTINLTATFARGAYTMTVTDATGVSQGNTLVGPGIPWGCVVLSVNGTTIVTNRRFQSAQSAVAIASYPSGLYATGGMELSTSTFRSGTQSLRLFKTGIGTASLECAIAIPVVPGRAFGCEWYYFIPSGGSGTASVYFQTKFVRVVDTGNIIPLVSSESDFVSDLPQSNIDLSAGRTWTQLFSSSNRVDFTSAHNGYAPDWATHMLLTINLASTPNGFQMFIDDIHGNAM